METILNTKANAFVISGAIGFAAAKFVFDVSTTKAVVVGVVIGSIAIALLSINTQSQTTVI